MRAEGVVAWLLVPALLAGCSSSRAAPGAEGPTFSPTLEARPVATQISEGPGSLQGSVLDDEFRPIAAAHVEIFRRHADLQFQLKLQSDAGGTYLVQGMAKGEYVVYVGKAGYAPDRPRLVDVEDGHVTFLRTTLGPAPRPDPFYVTRSFASLVTAWACLAVAGSNVTTLCANHEFASPSAGVFGADEPNTTDLETIVVESGWTPSNGACTAGVRNDAYAPGESDADLRADAARAPTNPFHWDNLPAVGGPTHLVVPRTGPNASAIRSPERTAWNGGANVTATGDWRVLVSPHARLAPASVADASCMVEQSVTTWVTMFFGRPAPRWEWSSFTAS